MVQCPRWALDCGGWELITRKGKFKTTLNVDILTDTWQIDRLTFVDMDILKEYPEKSCINLKSALIRSKYKL